MEKRKKLGKRLEATNKTINSYGCGLLCVAHCACTDAKAANNSVTRGNMQRLDPLISGK